MRFKHLFLFLLLCGLAACGGNGGRQSAQEPAANADSPAAEEIVPTFRRVPVPADCRGVAFEAYRAICALDGAEITTEAPEDCTLSYTTVTDDIEGYYEQTTYDCFPRPGGGWLVIETWCGGAEGEATAYISKAYDFSDGKATELEGILPIPAFDDVFDEEAVDPGNKDLIPGLQAVYRLRPEDFLAYHPDVEAQTLSVELRPADPYTEEQAANWLECFWDYRHIDDDMPQYRWDGKQFVK